MSIVERFNKIFPNAKVYWNGSINQLSLHFIDSSISEKEVQLKVYKELNFSGLLNAVESVAIYCY